jgi:pilus assembly protein Flp/PilA
MNGITLPLACKIDQRHSGGRSNMSKLIELTRKLKIWHDNRGQDLIEYALMAGFVAVAAGAIMPDVSTSISTVFSKVNSVMKAASS